jgi:uncharacterized protein
MPIDLPLLLAALLSGLFGSLHCAAMCGGLAAGFGAAAGDGRPSLTAALRLNAGRVLGYALAGAAAGALGGGLLQWLRSEILHSVLRVLLGGVLVLLALRLLDARRRVALLHRYSPGLWRWLAPLQRRLLPAVTPARQVALGMLWGWLPCGLSSTLLLAAWLQADAVHAALLMAVFGLGTLPLMLPLTWGGVQIGRRLAQPALRRTAATLILLSGLLTMAAPWLLHMPAAHALLAGLGCVR